MSTSTMTALTCADIAAAVGCLESTVGCLESTVGCLESTVGCNAATGVQGYSTDSRNVPVGGCFIALKGPRHDGSAFALQALAAGAALVVAGQSAPAHPQILRVADPLVALGQIAALARSRFEGPVLGITGSAGKTTLKEHMRRLLPAEWAAVLPEASHNNSEGLPRTILSAASDARCMVLELGTNAPGEIAALSAICRPTHAALTSIGAAHLQGLGSVAGVLNEKLDLARALPQGGLLFINADDEHLAHAELPKGLEVVRLGLTPAAGVRTPARREAGALWLRAGGERISHGLNAEVQVRALWIALNIAEALGVAETHLAAAAASAAPAHLRGQERQFGASLLVLDCYNANPLSMRAALEELSRRAAPRRAVLGEMLELGPETEASHRAVGVQLACSGIDEVLLVGPSAPFTAEAAHAAGLPAHCITVCPTRESAATAFRALVARGGTVLLKGSRGIALEKLLDGLHE